VFCWSRSHLKTGSTSSGSSCGISLLDIIADSSTALGLGVSAARVVVLLRESLSGAQLQRVVGATWGILDDLTAVCVNIRSILAV
jgi:hypothetical protein